MHSSQAEYLKKPTTDTLVANHAFLLIPSGDEPSKHGGPYGTVSRGSGRSDAATL